MDLYSVYKRLLHEINVFQISYNIVSLELYIIFSCEDLMNFLDFLRRGHSEKQ